MRRVPELDSLRGLAAIVVLLFHLSPLRFFFGWAGVDLFFVLSGYLITAIILTFSHQPGFLLRFYARRSLRIWPIYYLALAVLVAINGYLPEPQPMTALPYYLTYTQNVWLYWTNATVPFNPAFDHTWTLALEEQFYLIWPALVLWAGPRRTAKLCLATIALAYMARAGMLSWGRYSERILLARCDGFALGGLLAAWLVIDRPASQTLWHRPAFAFAALGALGYLVVGFWRGGVGWLGLPTPAHPAPTILAFGVLFFGIIGLVATFAGHAALAPLRFAPLAYLGQISYGLYLYHYPVYWALDGFAFRYDSSLGMSLAKLGASVALAMASWHLIERPILGLKERFRYDGARGGPPEPRPSGEDPTRREPGVPS